MRSKLAFRKRYGTAAPAFDVLVGVGGGPFREFGLCAHQTLHRRHIGKHKAAFAALVWCRRKAHNKQKFNHRFIFPVVGFFASSRSVAEHRLKTVNSTLRWHTRRMKSPERPILMRKRRARLMHFAVAA